jgi:hypothetical protein
LKVGQNRFRVPESLATTARLPFRNLRSIAWAENQLSAHCLASLISDNPMLNTIDVTCQVLIPAAVPAALCERGDTLQKLELRCADITEEQLNAIANSCASLTDFELTAFEDERVTEAGISAVIMGCAKLERMYVYLYGHRNPTSALMATALLNGIHLTHTYFKMALLNDNALLLRAASTATYKSCPVREVLNVKAATRFAICTNLPTLNLLNTLDPSQSFTPNPGTYEPKMLPFAPHCVAMDPFKRGHFDCR